MKKVLALLLIALLTAGPALAITGDGGSLVVQNGKVVVNGTAGGIPYFNPNNTLNSTGLLTLNGVVLGGGTSGPSSTAAGANNNVFRVPSGGGAPAFGSIDLANPSNAVLGTTVLTVPNGGSGAASFANVNQPLLAGSTTIGALVSLANGTSGQCLKSNGTTLAPTWQNCSGATPIAGFTTMGTLTQNSFMFASPSSNAGPLEVDVAWEVNGASSWANLACRSSVVPGSGQSYNIFMRRTQCDAAGAPGDSTTACAAATAPGGTDLGCTITAAAQGCQDTTHTRSPAAKECIAFCINSSATAATAFINCSVERTA